MKEDAKIWEEVLIIVVSILLKQSSLYLHEFLSSETAMLNLLYCWLYFEAV